MSDVENRDLIPPEDFAEAIAAFRENPDVDFMFTNAPRGARLLLGLLFYKGHFGDAADERQVQLCLADIEPELDEESISYLLDCDIEVGTKSYLRSLRERQVAAETGSQAADIQARPQVSEVNTARVDYNFEAIKRRLADKEAEENLQLQKEAELKAALRKKTLVSIGVKVVVGLLLSAVALYGYLWWRGRCAQRNAEIAERRRIEMEQERKAQAERALQREKFEAEALRRKKEQAENFKKFKLEQERKRAEHAKKIAAREKQYKERIAENERKMREEEEKRERFDSILNTFKNAAVGAWSDLDEKFRKDVFLFPGFFLVPDEDARGVVYENRVSNGESGIFKLSKSDADASVERTEIVDALLKRGALYMSADKKIYCIAPHLEKGVLFPASEYSCFPAQMVLQDLWRMMERLRVKTDFLQCDVSYVSRDEDGNGGVVQIGRFGLEENLRGSKIVEQVVAEFMKQYRRPAQKAVKKKRATVVLYDGELLKRGINGITYVPRSPRGNVRYTSDYRRLRDEAERQESEREMAEQNVDLEAQRAENEYRSRLSKKIEESLKGRCLSVRLVSVR